MKKMTRGILLVITSMMVASMSASNEPVWLNAQLFNTLLPVVNSVFQWMNTSPQIGLKKVDSEEGEHLKIILAETSLDTVISKLKAKNNNRVSYLYLNPEKDIDGDTAAQYLAYATDGIYASVDKTNYKSLEHLKRYIREFSWIRWLGSFFSIAKPVVIYANISPLKAVKFMNYFKCMDGYPNVVCTGSSLISNNYSEINIDLDINQRFNVLKYLHEKSMLHSELSHVSKNMGQYSDATQGFSYENLRRVAQSDHPQSTFTKIYNELPEYRKVATQSEFLKGLLDGTASQPILS